eukprot:3249316-Pyramimonas_sp.AAC.1
MYRVADLRTHWNPRDVSGLEVSTRGRVRQSLQQAKRATNIVHPRNGGTRRVDRTHGALTERRGGSKDHITFHA